MTASHPALLWTAAAATPQLPSLVDALRALGWAIRVASTGEAADIHEWVIVEWNDAADAGSLAEHCATHTRPVLVLLPSAANLAAALAQVRPGDDVACAGDGAAVLAARLQRLALRQLGHAAGHDALTGLPNRQTAKGWLDEALLRAADEDRALGLVLLDIDHFKQLNDRHGHQVGDRVLVRVAQHLRSLGRAGDGCARLGGEEFLLLLRREDAAQLRRDVERLLEVPVRLPDGPSLDCRLSAGVALVQGQQSQEAWLSQADMALYEAKARGRHRVVFYEELTARVPPEDAGQAVQIRHFENVTQVVTQRVASLVSLMGQQMMRTLQREARQDALTGVPNRGLFDRRIEREVELASRDGRPLALLFFDIDHFGRFNRDHGATVGDQVLRHFAATVAGGIRAVDWLARYGGEEFCVVMPAEIDEAAAAAERLRHLVEIAELPGPDGTSHHITTCVGVAAYAGGGESVPAWVLRASKALQQAKRAGRNRVARADRPEPEGAVA